jgi:hypothetical protein
VEHENREQQRQRIQQELRQVRLERREEEARFHETVIKWGRFFFSVNSAAWLALSCAASLAALRLMSEEAELEVAAFCLVFAVGALLVSHFFLEQLRRL